MALGADPLGERLRLRRLPGAVAALQGEEETVRRGGLHGVVPAAQGVPQVEPEGDPGAVVDLGEDQGGHRQQQGADQHQGEGGAAVREDELAVDQPVRADAGGDHRAEQRAQREENADDGVQVFGRTGSALVLGLLVEQGVPGVRGDAGGGAGQGEEQQDRGVVRDQPGGQQRQPGEGDRQREQTAPGQRGQQPGRGTDADHDTAGHGEHLKPVEHGSAAEVGGVQHAHADGGRDRARDGGAGQDEQRQHAGAALVGDHAVVGPRGHPRAAQPLQRRAGTRGAGVRQFQGGQQGERGREQARGDVGGQRRLVLGEPFDARAQQVVEQPGEDQRGRGHRHGHEARAQGQPAQRVHVVGQRAHRGALRWGRREQRGRRALPAHRPQPLGEPGDEGGHQEQQERVVRGPVDPQGGDDQQRGPQPVGADHGPAAVERTVRRGELAERVEQYGAEEKRREDACAEDAGDGEGHPVVAAAEGAAYGRRLEDQHDQDEQPQGVPDPADELRAPQPPELGPAQERPHGALAGVGDQGVVGTVHAARGLGIRTGGRWLLGSRHAFRLSAGADTSKQPPERTHGLRIYIPSYARNAQRRHGS
nr:hypothetical protein [Streptomyces sp. MH191]